MEQSMDFTDKIIYLCKQNNISVSSLEKSIGASNGSLAKHTDPRFSTVEAVADYFGIPITYFCSNHNNVTNDEAAILSAYKAFNNLGRIELSDYIGYMRTKPQYIKSDSHGALETAI